MGLRSREILKTPLGKIRVISLAGDDPPLSCLNDGLQVSTGASLGRGTISVSDVTFEPAAIFVNNGCRLKLELKKEVLQKIRSQIRNAREKSGG